MGLIILHSSQSNHLSKHQSQSHSKNSNWIMKDPSVDQSTADDKWLTENGKIEIKFFKPVFEPFRVARIQN